MKKLRHLALAASMIVIAACATTTPYQAASEPGGFDGYSQTMLTSNKARVTFGGCLLYTSPSPRDATLSRMPSSA